MITTGQSIKAEEGDAPEFIEIINNIMGLMIFQYAIKEVVLVKLNYYRLKPVDLSSPERRLKLA